ncbi:hypothetical protein ACQUJO_21965 [Ralstonia pseudosolanacearum]
MPKKILKNEPQYAIALFGSAFAVVLFLTYVFPHEIASTQPVMRFVNLIAKFVPVLADFQRHVPPYTPYWGLFYAVLWSMAPIGLIMGFAGTFHLTELRYQKLIIEATNARIFVIFLIFIPAFWFFLYFPPYSFYAMLGDSDGVTFRQIIYVSMIVGGWYFIGRLLGALVVRHKAKQGM